MPAALRFVPGAVALLELVLLAWLLFSSDLVADEGVTGAFWSLSWVGFLIVGALLVARLPHHRVAWAMFGIGAVLILGVAGDVVLDAASAADWAPWLAWIGAWMFIPAFGLVALFLLWYPTGLVPSPRWTLLQRALVTLGAVLTVYYALRPGGTPADPAIENPLGITALEGVRDTAVEGAAGALLAVLGVAAAVSLVFRWRASRDSERQQLKWVLVPALWFPLGFFVFGLVIDEGTVSDIGVVFFTWFLGMNAMAVGVGIAITRYRLYEIDRIINRTVVFGAVAALLAVLFASSVALTSAVLPTGSSDLGIAASTLAVAALFNPLRRRVQAAVNRRFYRTRYDPQRVTDQLAGRLRDLIDPSTVGRAWVDTATRALQ
ncbi:MAG: hypothetical protein R3246_09665, partial [Acidimicrobiia bacterium]|nr:hypothetical protein [Acidimicrobiia bacterium]